VKRSTRRGARPNGDLWWAVPGRTLWPGTGAVLDRFWRFPVASLLRVRSGGLSQPMMQNGVDADSSGAEEDEGRSDRVFKWVAVVAGACLLAFVVFVVARGQSHGTPASSARLESAPPPLLKDGTAGPLFTLPALDGGAPVTLAAFRGTPVMVNFFASWCSDCRQELDAVASVAKANSGRVAVVGVDANETSDAAAERLLAAAHATYPVADDTTAKVSSAYLVQALPVTYFLNAQGQVVGAALGPQTVASLDRWVARLEGRR